MKTGRLRLLLIAVTSFVGVGASDVATGQPASPQDANQSREPGVSRPAGEREFGASRPLRRRKSKLNVRWAELAARRTFRLAKLERLMGQELSLSQQQIVAIQRVLQRYNAELDATVADLKALGKRRARDSRTDLNERNEFKPKLKAARQAGDEAIVNRPTNQVLQGTLSSTSLAPIAMKLLSAPTELYEHLSAELHPSQRGQFDRLVQRWWTLYPQQPIEYPLGRLLRAVTDPELRISVAQRMTLRKLVADASSDLNPLFADEALVSDRYKKVLRSISKSLESEQRAHFQSTLKEIAEDAVAERAALEQWEKKHPKRAARGSFKKEAPAP